MTASYGIFGWPVSHSLSPAMHNAAFRELAIDGVYVPFAVPPQRLNEAVKAIVALNIQGVNVTLPHKLDVVRMLDEVEAPARIIGAVNCITNRNGRLLGSNTDAPGLVHFLHEANVPVADRKICVLGTGGAARAAVSGLLQSGAAEITVLARTFRHAEELVSDFQTQLKKTVLIPADLERAQDWTARAQLLIQASSAMLHDGPQAQDFLKRLNLPALQTDTAVVDLAYGPQGTPLTRAANARGLKAYDGRGMLLHQARLSFEQWTDKQAPTNVMAAALENEA
ncbi:MAG: shikimate dehydrogenase [Myxococcales bacterium]|nr:shikimate dehydrogenase [Myxococcales bacterium]MCB9707501.1 shikimate dehydrogenase [Myxococcales bacterium]